MVHSCTVWRDIFQVSKDTISAEPRVLEPLCDLYHDSLLRCFSLSQTLSMALCQPLQEDDRVFRVHVRKVLLNRDHNLYFHLALLGRWLHGWIR